MDKEQERFQRFFDDLQELCERHRVELVPAADGNGEESWAVVEVHDEGGGWPPPVIGEIHRCDRVGGLATYTVDRGRTRVFKGLPV